MKIIKLLSMLALLLSGLVLVAMAAQIWLAPDVFARTIGHTRLPSAAVTTLALEHGAVLFGLGLFALASAFLSPLLRWLSLGLLVTAGVAAWFGLWQFGVAAGSAYAAVLKTLFAADGLSLMAITVRLDADRPGPQASDAHYHFDWG